MQDQSLESCIQLCWNARHLCQKTLIGHCLPMGGEHVAPAHVELMLSAIEICQTAADFMTRSSPLHTSICAACANVCEACADSSEAILCADNQPCPEMQRCADALRAAANACRTTGQQGIIPLPANEATRPQEYQ
jgi:hypothetical protein